MGKRQFKSKSFAKQKNFTLNPKVANMYIEYIHQDQQGIRRELL